MHILFVIRMKTTDPNKLGLIYIKKPQREDSQMKQIPSRDITGYCDGECKNLVREGELKRQKEISSYAYSHESSVSLPWAKHRNEQPGFFGGHV